MFHNGINRWNNGAALNKLTPLKLNAPFLILLGDIDDNAYAKTAFGLVQWRPESVAGQLRFSNCPVDLGVPDLSVTEAVAAGARSLVIGVAPVGGTIPNSWSIVIEEAARAGLDIVSGLHQKLDEYPPFAKAAAVGGGRLIDVRAAPNAPPVGNGRKRSGKRLLMVGTDCAVGKKYSALALHKAMQKAGLNSSFRATGQTGIMIEGSGIPLDAVVGDFTSGAAETVSPDNAEDHWDVIEGQGSLFHPGYAAVALGLLHGSQPDAIVVCHAADRQELYGWPGFSVPTISDCIDRNILEGSLTNPKIQCVGVCINTSMLSAAERVRYLKDICDEVGLPCIDPIADGCDPIVEIIQHKFS